MPQLRNFSGGLNKRLDETRIPDNQGIEFKNIDNSGGILKSAKNNKALPDINRAQINSVSQGNTRFTFHTGNTIATYSPVLSFGDRKQYSVVFFYITQAVGNTPSRISIWGPTGNTLDIPDGEDYQIIIETIEAGTNTPAKITLNTRDAIKTNRTNTGELNNIRFEGVDVSAFENKAFSIIVVPLRESDSNPLGLDSGEVLSRLRGRTFFRESGSSLIEFNGAAYFTRQNGKPLKIYGTTRNFDDVSYNINQPYLSEHFCVSSRQGLFQRITTTDSAATSSSAFRLASLFEYAGYTLRVCGNKILRWRSKTLHTTELDIGNTRRLDNLSTASIEESRITYLNSPLDAEAIPGYTFKFLTDGKLVIGDRVEFDLTSHVSGTSLVNYDTFPRLTVLDYPTNFVPDITKTNEQNLNTLREGILRTKIMIYTNDKKAHIVSFTRDGTEQGAITLRYEPATSSGTTTDTSFDITTTDTINRGVLGALGGIDRHIVYGLNTDDEVNAFADTSPLYAKVETIDMDLGDEVRAIQVDRDTNQLFAMNIRRFGDPRLPTGSDSTFDLDLFSINKDTAAVSNILRSHPMRLRTFTPRIGYWAEPNGNRIATTLDASTLREDTDNLSLTENLGIQPPPRGDDDEPLRVLGFTPFNPENLTFPANVDLNLTSDYRSIAGGGGESTRTSRAYEREVYEDPITVPIRIIITGKDNNQQKVVREYMVTLDDEAITQTSRDNCRQKGSFFSRRTECTRQTTTNVRRGFTLDLDTYYSDNTNSHDIEVAIGIPNEEGETVYRQLPGILSKANRSLTTPNYINYENPETVSAGTMHKRTFTSTIGSEYEAAATAVTDSCRVRYCYTYYNANRNLKSAPSKITDEISVSRNDPLEIEGFVLPEDPQVTDIRLYRICPELGETAFTLIEQLPLNHIDGSLLTDIVATDELTRAALGDLTYNDNRQLVFRQPVPAVLNPDGTVATPATHTDTVIVNADGTRSDVEGFDEQYNSYINANGRILDSWDNLPPPPLNENDESLLGHISYLIPVSGALVGIIGQRIHWSKVGFPDYWPARNFLDFNEDVTGLIEVSDGLLVFTQNETHLIRNFPNPATISRTLITNEQGCVHIRTPQFLRGIPIWISNDGICTYQNGRVVVLSRGLLGSEYLRGDIITTEIHNDVYYILYNDRIVTMDQRFLTTLQSGVEQIATNFVEYDTNGVRFIEKFDGEDILYGTTATNTIVEMFAGDEDLPMEYVSPKITLTEEERIKLFDRLFVAYKQGGGLALQVRLFNLSETPIVKDYALVESRGVTKDYRLPGNSFYAIQFRVIGKGEVSAISYSAAPSKGVPPTKNN